MRNGKQVNNSKQKQKQKYRGMFETQNDIKCLRRETETSCFPTGRLRSLGQRDMFYCVQTIAETSTRVNTSAFKAPEEGTEVSLVRYPMSTYIFILNSCLLPVPNSSMEPTQMKSSVTIYL